jgi:ABC-type multidrug transport system fused ATPase/permease subunit
VTALLVSDRERDNTVRLLRTHWLSGRLTAEEFEQRVDEALRARFATDLWRALRALPVDASFMPRRTTGRGSAVASVVTGAMAIFILMMSLGLLFVVALPLAVTAWALGRDARRSGDPHRHGMARAGEVLGIIGTALSLLLLAGCAAILGYL